MFCHLLQGIHQQILNGTDGFSHNMRNFVGRYTEINFNVRACCSSSFEKLEAHHVWLADRTYLLTFLSNTRSSIDHKNPSGLRALGWGIKMLNDLIARDLIQPYDKRSIHTNDSGQALARL